MSDAHGHGHDDGHGDDGHGEHDVHHPSLKFYVGIGIALAIVTGIELIPLLEIMPFPAWVLILLSAVKFAAVVAFFMHLYFDSPIYTKLFVGPLFLAIAVIAGLMALFGAFGREEAIAAANAERARLAAEQPQVAAAHGGEGGHGEEGGAAAPALPALADVVKDPAAAAAGKALFATTCVPCHGIGGTGAVIGPALTDAEWKNTDGTPEGILSVLQKGVPGTAMVAWTSTYTPAQLQELTAYVHGLGGGK